MSNDFSFVNISEKGHNAKKKGGRQVWADEICVPAPTPMENIAYKVVLI